MLFDGSVRRSPPAGALAAAAPPHLIDGDALELSSFQFGSLVISKGGSQWTRRRCRGWQVFSVWPATAAGRFRWTFLLRRWSAFPGPISKSKLTQKLRYEGNGLVVESPRSLAIRMRCARSDTGMKDILVHLYAIDIPGERLRLDEPARKAVLAGFTTSRILLQEDHRVMRKCNKSSSESSKSLAFPAEATSFSRR